MDDLTTGLSGVMTIGSGWGVRTDACDGTFDPQGHTTNLSFSGGYTAEWIVEDYAELGCLSRSPPTARLTSAASRQAWRRGA